MSHPLAWLARAALALAVAGSALACAGEAAPSFDPAGPCTVDGQRPGAYPDLEARLPETWDGEAPARLDSGRSCTAGNLGTLAGHGISEVQFAGALWETGRASGVTMAVFEAPGLTMERMAEFYEAGARSARRTERIETGRVEIGGLAAWRLDAFVEETYQTIVVLEGSEEDRVPVVLVASDLGEAESRAAHDETVERAATAVADA